MKRIKLLDVISFLFIVLFIYAATSKLLEYHLFKAQIGKSPLIMRYADLLAWLVPSLEILIALMLIVPRTLLFGLFASFFLMLMFTSYIAFMLTFSPYVPCSCGGVLNSLGWTEHLIFNVAFTLLALVGIVLFNRQNKYEAEAQLNYVASQDFRNRRRP